MPIIIISREFDYFVIVFQSTWPATTHTIFVCYYIPFARVAMIVIKFTAAVGTYALHDFRVRNTAARRNNLNDIVARWRFRFRFFLYI